MLVKQFKFKRNSDRGGFQWTAESEIERPGCYRGFTAGYRRCTRPASRAECRRPGVAIGIRTSEACGEPGHPTLALDAESVHTATMNLKNAAPLAAIGTILLTILEAADFIKTVSGVLNDVIPAMALLRSLVYLFASLSVTLFFCVFNKAQSR